MSERKYRCLLIWPPFITVSKLPLGIPFLTAYLKNGGINDIEVIDLNMAYLRQMKFFWFLHRFNRWYNDLGGKVSGELKKPKRNTSAAIKKNKTFLKQVISHAFRFINRILNTLLDYEEYKKKQSIPWSLESILTVDFKNSYASERKKIRRALNHAFKENDFSLIGISVIYPEQLFFAFLIAKTVKEEFNRDTRIAFGGSQVTKHIRHIANSKNVYDFVDFFITDDGEEPLTKLLKVLPENRFSEVPSLYFKNSDKAKGYGKTHGCFYLHPKDFLTPDFEGFDLGIYGNQMPVLASKGCFWSKCSFCTYASMQEHRYSVSTVEKTAGIIKEMKNTYGVLKFRFVDDELTPKFMGRLAEVLTGDKFNIRWMSNIVLSKEFADKDFCDALTNSGLFQVAIGLESVSPRIIKLMDKYHKNLSEREIRDILANIKKAGIKIGIYIIFGFPTETFDEARQTLNFLVENKDLYDVCMLQPFSLEDNTPVFNNPEKFGITRIYNDDKKFGERLGCRYDIAEGMSQEDAEEFTYKEAFRALKKANVRVRSAKVRTY